MPTRVAGVLLALAVSAFAQAQQVTIKGLVVDQEGKPVAGADVATFWAEGTPFDAVQTDAEGRFCLSVKNSGKRPVAVMVQDKQRKRGVISRFSSRSFGKQRKLELEQLVRVSGKLVSSELGERPPWTNVYVNVLPGHLRVARCGSDDAEFRFLLPSGDYRLHMYGADVKSKDVERFIEGDEGAIDLGEIDLPATEVAKLYGKKPHALNVTAARGVGPDVKWSDFLGRHVILEFWGFW